MQKSTNLETKVSKLNSEFDSMQFDYLVLALSYDRIYSIYIWKFFDNYKVYVLHGKYAKVQNRI